MERLTDGEAVQRGSDAGHVQLVQPWQANIVITIAYGNNHQDYQTASARCLQEDGSQQGSSASACKIKQARPDACAAVT